MGCSRSMLGSYWGENKAQAPIHEWFYALPGAWLTDHP